MAQKYKAPRLTVPVGDQDHSEGPQDAPMVLVEYGDYQCPYCGAAHPIVKKVQKALGSSLRFVFRNFPLTNIHEHAQWAAEVAEAAGAQGKFWEMHDYLYDNKKLLGDEAFFAKFEAKLGLDVSRLNRETAQHTYTKRIQDDFLSGIRSGVNGTPTFFVNGVRYDDYPGFGPLVSALKEAVQEKQKESGRGRRRLLASESATQT